MAIFSKNGNLLQSNRLREIISKSEQVTRDSFLKCIPRYAFPTCPILDCILYFIKLQHF